MMEEQEFIERYASHLSAEQLAGVRTTEGFVLLLAVPGSGKTTALVTRLGYLVLVKGVMPEKLLTVTYTVAATEDMRRRFAEVFGEGLSARLEFRTINGICAKIISRYAEKAGKTSYSLVTDERDTARVLTDALARNLSEYPTESDIKTARTLITYCKNMMFDDAQIERFGEEQGFPLLPVYQAYNAFLKGNSCMDYDDQMRYALVMLQKIPWLLENYRENYRYVLVDEAQDTSKIQHEIIRLLTGEKGNLFMVGDEDQSIYGFRGAYPEALLHFEEVHPDAKVLVMHQNYRSGAQIASVAEKLIRHNKQRHEKNMVAVRNRESRINYVDVIGRPAQYSYLLKVAADCDRETAVLYRDNESALPLIDLLERQGIPYRVRKGEYSFFTSRIVTDITNILRFALDPYDGELFLKIYYKCNTYLKKDQALELQRISELNGRPVLDGIHEMESLGAKKINALKELKRNLKSMLEESPSGALSRIITSLGYGEYAAQKGLDENKLYILRMLARQENTAARFLGRLETLQTMLQEKTWDPKCPFVLSTIHSSKGLEYERVFLMDIVDGVFPASANASVHADPEDAAAMEEERRLFYVGITRAIDELFVFCCEGSPSKFVKEMGRIPPKKEEKKESTVYRRPETPEYLKPKTEPVIGDEVLRIGERVRHKKYGEGTVTDIMTDGGRVKRFTVLLDTGEAKLFTPLAFQTALTIIGK